MNNCPLPIPLSANASFEEKKKAYEDTLKYWECRYRSAEEVLMRLAHDVSRTCADSAMYLRKDVTQLRNELKLLEAVLNRNWEEENAKAIQAHKFSV